MTANFSVKTISSIFIGIFIAIYFLGVYWSFEPDELDIKMEVTQAAQKLNVAPVVGFTTTTALILVSETVCWVRCVVFFYY